MTPGWVDVAYLVAAVCFILALRGLSSPRTARRGNLIGVAGGLLAMLVVFVHERPGHLVWILLTIAVGSAVGAVVSRRVAMTAMPQLVALFNGVGGGAAALVALLELTGAQPLRALEDAGSVRYGWFSYSTLADGAQLSAGVLEDLQLTADTLSYVGLGATAFTLFVGAVSFAGSVVTFLKLQELMTTRPVLFPGGPVVFGASLAAAVLVAGWLVAAGWLGAGVVLALVGLLVGVLLVLPVGGADVPVVISLLNAFTGLAVAATGYVLGNTLLLVAGTLVGASGTILTRAMAVAMGRSVKGILFGAFTAIAAAQASGAAEERTVRSVGADDVAILLSFAHRVVIVPGYGLAVAQAQHTIHELAEILESKGVEVSYGIHPVAGRMPGHMNVLLAEANVPYEQLLELDQSNAALRTADVALVVGANDVVNPAAKTTPSAPIYGMPILDVEGAKAVVFLKRSMRPGFAGIENELLFDPKTTLLFGDAKASLTSLLGAVKSM